MKVKVRDIVAALEIVIRLDGPPTRLRDAIASVLQENFGLLEIQAAENAELLEDRVRELIIVEGETNPSPTLTIVASADHLVSGYCYLNPSDSPEVAKAKRGRLNIEPLLQEMRNLTFQDFERFGARVLTELGAKDVRVTPRSKDQGIDFYGILTLGQTSFLPPPFGQLAHDVKLLFAGQAKHFATKNPVGPELIRELIGSISLARHKTFTIDEDLFEKGIELLPFNPLVTMFFTTGRFTSGALELAQKSGVIAKSGEQLALFLADKGIGMDTNSGEFDKARFYHWLAS